MQGRIVCSGKSRAASVHHDGSRWGQISEVVPDIIVLCEQSGLGRVDPLDRCSHQALWKQDKGNTQPSHRRRLSKPRVGNARLTHRVMAIVGLGI